MTGGGESLDDGVVESLVEAGGSDHAAGAGSGCRARRHCSCARSTTSCSTPCSPTRATSSSRRSPPTTSDSGSWSAEWGGRRRRADPHAHGAGRWRRRRCTPRPRSATRRCSTRSSAWRRATRSPASPTVGCSTSRWSVRRRARNACGTPLSLLVFDVDHFKQINDTYGHLDRRRGAPRRSPTSIVASTKSFDVAARYGGDEFVLLLPGCERDDAIGVAERVRAEIGRQVRDAPVTVSAGARHDARQRHRRRAAAVRGRRRALRGEAQRPRPCRARRSARPARWRRWSCVSTRRSSPAAPDVAASTRSPARAPLRCVSGRFPEDPPTGGSRRPRGARVIQRVDEADVPEESESWWGSWRWRRCPPWVSASLPPPTPPRPRPTARTAPARPAPQLTDAQKQCLADQGVTLPQRPPLTAPGNGPLRPPTSSGRASAPQPRRAACRHHRPATIDPATVPVDRAVPVPRSPTRRSSVWPTRV